MNNILDGFKYLVHTIVQHVLDLQFYSLTKPYHYDWSVVVVDNKPRNLSAADNFC